MPAAESRAERWLFGPVPDLVLGCGLGYAALFLFQAFDGATMRTWLPVGLGPLFLLVAGTPHYGATLLRVYERPEERRRYRFFTVYTTIALSALFLVSLRSGLVGSWLLTIYLTWSPWHYGGQNYGLAVMFLRRRGIDVPLRAKRLLYASFVLSFALAFLAVHSAAYSGGSYAPDAYRESADSVSLLAYHFLPLGIPAAVTGPLIAVTFAAYLVCLVGAASLLLRSGRVRDLVPSAALVATQALWFSVPVVVQYWTLLPGVEPLRVEFSRYAFIWIAFGHSVQYLWVTAYFAKRQPAFEGARVWYAKCLVAGAAAWGVPALLFGPHLLGGPEYRGGLHLLIASVVNLHHFLLDGAIWKLRDGRVARILIRPSDETTAALAPAGAGRLAWVRPLVYAGGLLSVVAITVSAVENEYGWARALARRDEARMVEAAQRLWLVGRPNSQIEIDLGSLAAERGDFERALVHLERSIAIHPLPKAFYLRGLIYERRREWSRAIESFEIASTLMPDRPEIREALVRVRSAADAGPAATREPL